MAIANIGGAEIYYELHGRGKPLLMIAGLASDSQSWLPVLPILAEKHQVIVFDNRGVGRTSPMEGELSISCMADDCIGLLKFLDIERADFVGHSMGGFVALEVAVRYPAFVDSLTLVATAATNSQRNNELFSDWTSGLLIGTDRERWFKNLFYWIFTEQFFENPQSAREALRGAMQYQYPQTVAAFCSQVRAISAFDITKALPSINARTLVISGREDMLFTESASARFASAIRGAEYCVIENAAHSVYTEQPNLFCRAVLEFINRHKI